MWPFKKREACPTGRFYAEHELRKILAGLPWVTEKTRIRLHDSGVFVGLSWRDMARIYAKTSVCGPYKEDVWDCDKYTRYAAAEVNRIWADLGGKEPLAHGVFYGLVCLDGDNFSTGPHSLCFFIDSDGLFRSYGAQERKIKSGSEMSVIKEIWEINVGG